MTRDSTILHITSAEVVGPTHLSLQFSNGASGRVDVSPLLRGPVFEPLQDPAVFAQAVLDRELHTVTWPSGADLAPEALLDLLILQSFAPCAENQMASVLDSVKRAARRYQELTGRPLGIAGEIAEIEAVQKLRLIPTPVRHPGYDALRFGVDGIERLQIKGRRLTNGTRKCGRLGRLCLEEPWDSVVLVLLDSAFDATAIYEADRPVVERALLEPGSRSRNERGQLAISKFLQIGRQVWSRN